METTYRMIGADGQTYGPVSLGEIKSWIAENRIGPQTQISRDGTAWVNAGTLPELGLGAAPVAAGATAPAPLTPASPPGVAEAELALDRRIKAGGSWFYWIAGLSLINTIAALSGGSWRFIIGLGLTQVFDSVAHGLGRGGAAVALVLDLLVMGVFILFGIFANKRRTWAFIAGMVLFALDGAIFLLVSDWIGVAFHAFVLYCLFKGWQACREWHQWKAGVTAGG